MGATKTDHYSDYQNEIAKVAKALGHPARVAIIGYLVQKNACICGDIVNELPLSQPTVSQHLKELKNAGIIKGDIKGNSICYCIDEQVISDMIDNLSDILKKLKNRTLCC
jgi:DNA-binding transcriptional ArsR family regulator